jgi:hypothetical protein
LTDEIFYMAHRIRNLYFSYALTTRGASEAPESAALATLAPNVASSALHAVRTLTADGASIATVVELFNNTRHTSATSGGFHTKHTQIS